MYGTLLLDEQGDLLEAVEDYEGSEYTTIGVAVGSQQVAQALSLRASTRKKSVWFNLTAGIDYSGLFYDTNIADSTMNPIRAQVFREALEGTPGFESFPEGREVVFTRTNRTLAVALPCVQIDCDSSRVIPRTLG